MAKKPVDPLKAKEKKQKILLAVLGVVFLGLMAFQLPRVMKQLNPPAPPVQTTATTGTATPGPPTLAAPTLRGAAQGGMETTDSSGASTGGSSAGSGSGSGSGTDAEDPGVPDLPGTEPAPGSAIISLNGTLYTVPVGTDFPQSSPTDPTLVPLFHLVSLTAHTARISIVGGAYSSGARTVTLKEKKAVTLMNTADGTRYKLILMPLGTEVPTGGSGSTTTPTTVTLPPATP
jgi:hypothetical protein